MLGLKSELGRRVSLSQSDHWQEEAWIIGGCGKFVYEKVVVLRRDPPGSRRRVAECLGWVPSENWRKQKTA